MNFNKLTNIFQKLQSGCRIVAKLRFCNLKGIS